MAKQQENNELNRIPPQAVDVEEAVLGAIMVEPGSDISIVETLKPESFYKEAHQRIFRAIVQLSSEHLPIDQLTIVDQLRKNEDLDFVGGPYYVNLLASKVGSAAHLEYHAKIVAEKYIKREIISIANKMQTKAYEPGEDVQDLLEFSEKKIFDLAFENIKSSSKALEQLIHDAINRIEELGKRETTLSGVPSGFPSLDRVTSGWQRSDLVIVAARPSMGKTAFVLSMARNMAVDHGVPVAIFSLEMSGIQLVTRLMVGETEISSEKLRTGKLENHEWRQLEEKIKPLEKAKIFIDDTPAISLIELRAKCRNLKIQQGIELVVIDYLQLMTGPPETRNNREQEVSTISRGLKAIAKELEIPVIALSQLNRSVESRTDKRPQLSDLRESGAIEQDADIVTFIHRPEKYGILTDDNGNSLQGLAEIIIAKHRNGAVTDVHLKFIDYMAKFTEPDTPIDDNFDGGELTLSSKMNDDSTFEGTNLNDNFNNSTPF
ncbi:MAG: replicative DNA helicase [Bacteroidales bacterium]|nr:replicative DNA helicase [Bacteroidales bacterium]